MKYPTNRIYRAWIRFCHDLRRIWNWHHAQMNNNAPYARALVQGVVRALWQETIERMLGVLAKAAVDLYVIVRREGINANRAFNRQ